MKLEEGLKLPPESKFFKLRHAWVYELGLSHMMQLEVDSFFSGIFFFESLLHLGLGVDCLCHMACINSKPPPCLSETLDVCEDHIINKERFSETPFCFLVLLSSLVFERIGPLLLTTKWPGLLDLASGVLQRSTGKSWSRTVCGHVPSLHICMWVLLCWLILFSIPPLFRSSFVCLNAHAQFGPFFLADMYFFQTFIYFFGMWICIYVSLDG
jgi:hypothetical protein